MPASAEAPSPVQAPTPTVETSEPATPQSTTEHGVTPGRELIPMTPVAVEASKAPMTDAQIKAEAGDPPSLEFLSGKNTPAGSENMSLADQNRAKARLDGLGPLAKQREEQRIAAEAQSGEVLSVRNAENAYAAAPVIEGEVTVLPGEADPTDTVIVQEQEITPSTKAVQTEVVQATQPEAAINLGPADPRILQLLAQYDETTAMYKAKIATLQAQLAAEQKQKAEATQVTPQTPSTETPATNTEATTTTPANPDQSAPADDKTKQESEPETPKSYRQLLREARELVEKHGVESKSTTLDELKAVHGKIKGEKTPGENKSITSEERKEYELYKKILLAKIYQKHLDGEPLTAESLALSAQAALKDSNTLTKLQKITETSEIATAAKLTKNVEDNLDAQIQEMRENPDIPAAERDKVAAHMDELVDYVLSSGTKIEDEKDKLTLWKILVALGLIAFAQMKDTAAEVVK